MKYDPLRRFLEAAGDAALPLSFAEIEEILGAPLPPSARRHAAWWSNNPTNHVNAQAWIAAGYVTERVDLKGQRLIFARRRPVQSAADAAEGRRPSSPRLGLVERLRARLGDSVRVALGVDLTQPTGEIWNAEIE
jgi:YD repeat-containing protein